MNKKCYGGEFALSMLVLAFMGYAGPSVETVLQPGSSMVRFPMGDAKCLDEQWMSCMSLSVADVEAYYKKCREERLSLLAFYLSLQTFDKVYSITEDFLKEKNKGTSVQRKNFDRGYFESRAMDTGSCESFQHAKRSNLKLLAARSAFSENTPAEEREKSVEKLDMYIWEQRNQCMATRYFSSVLVECQPYSKDDGGEDDFVIKAIRGMKYWEARYIVFFHKIIMGHLCVKGEE